MGTESDFDPGRPLFSDRGVSAICGTAIGLAIIGLLGFVAWRDIGTFGGILGVGATIGVFVFFVLGVEGAGHAD
jgi:FtsH-binding integral membrane protein